MVTSLSCRNACILTDLTDKWKLFRAASVHPLGAILDNTCLGRTVWLISFPIEIVQHLACIKKTGTYVVHVLHYLNRPAWRWIKQSIPWLYKKRKFGARSGIRS